MSEIVAKVARAIAEKLRDGFENEGQTLAQMQELATLTGEDYVAAARAAIAAMREPTEAMVDVADVILPDLPWREMIDEALEPHPH